ncbi:hypothetical protein M902_1186 [Bacteriovorax sp. BAL6_X]|uniref:hypothetical protein n=1 Tax=Bacteriovorax sp. BAL6_X TaxID=1201290 RepID=UPI0003855492|nr:hypothetical protein [Bacteriovorax sp. BAL6_X]EPZ49406.1 hypothetical protein M902_1186 [Bacteriovorax sp. BAL6_X]
MSLAKYLKLFTLLILCFLGQAASAEFSYLKIDGIFGIGTNDKMDQYDTATTGIGYNISYGVRNRVIGIEAFYTSIDLSGDISHGGVNRVAVQSLNIYGVELHFYPTLRLAIKLGYAFSSFNDYLENNTDDNIFAGAASTYGLKRNTTLGGLRLGVAYDFFHIGRKLHFQSGYTYQENGNGHENLISLGIVFKFNRGILDRLIR